MIYSNVQNTSATASRVRSAGVKSGDGSFCVPSTCAGIENKYEKVHMCMKRLPHVDATYLEEFGHVVEESLNVVLVSSSFVLRHDG